MSGLSHYHHYNDY